MYVEFLARFVKNNNPKTKEEFEQREEELRVRYLTTGIEGAPEFKKVEYEYSPMTIDMRNDVKLFNEFDNNHTTVTLHGGVSYVFKVKYLVFKGAFQVAKGNIQIIPYTDFEDVVIELSGNH